MLLERKRQEEKKKKHPEKLKEERKRTEKCNCYIAKPLFVYEWLNINSAKCFCTKSNQMLTAVSMG